MLPEMEEFSHTDSCVTVITVVKDHAVGLLKTMESLLSQNFARWNSIIVVGSSTDSTLETANEFARKDYRITVLLQEDTGIYEAMNLGIAQSQSALLWFMNSGDTFMNSNSLWHGVESLSKSNVGFIVGGYKIIDQPKVYWQSKFRLTPLRFAYTRRGGCHQAMIFKRSAVIENGLFDTRYRLASDYDLCLKILQNTGASKCSEILALMEPNGRTDNSLVKMHHEKLMIRNQFFGDTPWLTTVSSIWMHLALMKFKIRIFLRSKQGFN